MLESGEIFKIGTNGGLCKSGNGPPDSLKVNYLGSYMARRSQHSDTKIEVDEAP